MWTIHWMVSSSQLRRWNRNRFTCKWTNKMIKINNSKHDENKSFDSLSSLFSFIFACNSRQRQIKYLCHKIHLATIERRLIFHWNRFLMNESCLEFPFHSFICSNLSFGFFYVLLASVASIFGVYLTESFRSSNIIFFGCSLSIFFILIKWAHARANHVASTAFLVLPYLSSKNVYKLLSLLSIVYSVWVQMCARLNTYRNILSSHQNDVERHKKKGK